MINFPFYQPGIHCKKCPHTYKCTSGQICTVFVHHTIEAWVSANIVINFGGLFILFCLNTRPSRSRYEIDGGTWSNIGIRRIKVHRPSITSAWVVGFIIFKEILNPHNVLWFSRAWFYCKACHEDIKDENLIKKCKCKNCKLNPSVAFFHNHHVR